MVEKTHQEPLITLHSEFKNNKDEYGFMNIIGKGKYKSIYDNRSKEMAFSGEKIELVELTKFFVPVSKPVKWRDVVIDKSKISDIYNSVVKTKDLPLWKALDVFLADNKFFDDNLTEEIELIEENGEQLFGNIFGHFVKYWVEIFLLIRFAEETGYMFAFDNYFKIYGDNKKKLQFHKWTFNQKKSIWGSDRRRNYFIYEFTINRILNKRNTDRSIIDINLPIAEQHAMISAWILEDVHIQDYGSKLQYDTYVKWASMFAKISLLIGHGHYDYEFHDNYFFHTKTKEKLKTKREFLLKTFKECFPEVNDKDLRRYALEHGKRRNDKYQNLRGRADKRTDM